MKKSSFLLSLTLSPFLMLTCLSVLVMSCGQTTVATVNELRVNDTLTIQNGDLLFVGLPEDFSLSDSTGMDGAIAAATGTEGELNYIHVAILEVDEQDSLWVIDATIKHGVDRHPFAVFLSDFTLADGSYPQLDIMRLKDNAHVDEYVSNAKTFCGLPYDKYFLPDNDAQYCSELVRNAYRSPEQDYVFSEKPMNFKAADGSIPPYWVELFAILGEPIPQGVPGTNPNEMSQENCLKRVGELKIEN